MPGDNHSKPRRRGWRIQIGAGCRGLATLWLGVLLLSLPAIGLGAIGGADPNETSGTTPATRLLTIQDIEVTGNRRTSQRTVALYFPLHSGDRVDQPGLLDAVARLRASGIFKAVDFYTRPGSERGHLIVVLEVEEKGVEVRFGSGNTSFDGWYLIPAQLAFDNRLGRGERIDLQIKLGYRHTGVAFNYDEPRVGDGDSYWGLRAEALNTDRIYFFSGAEYRHQVASGSGTAYFGRKFGSHWFSELGLKFETVEADSFATVYQDDPVRYRKVGDELPFEALPEDIAKAAGKRERGLVRLDLGYDSRNTTQVAGTPVSGLWGRLRGQGFLQQNDSFLAASLDLRGYQTVPGGVLAIRLRGQVVGDKAAFYDRLYLGGLYTVRGFPSQGLTRPYGDTWLWSASGEYRAPLIGTGARPRLAGVLFFDVGDSGSEAGPAFRNVAMSVGYGLRLRVAWLGWVGLDFGIPLSFSPLDEAFHTHVSIGWTF
ncbi:MAG: BamA/TamA family outer membrane protein [bacterium]